MYLNSQCSRHFLQYLFWSCIPAYCTSWACLVWKSSRRGCLASQPNPVRQHSLLRDAENPRRRSQSTETVKHTHRMKIWFVFYYYDKEKTVRSFRKYNNDKISDWPRPSPRPAIARRASECRSLYCLASVWRCSDEAQGSTRDVLECLPHSCQCTKRGYTNTEIWAESNRGEVF